MSKTLFIALNPQKCRKFITKGINLNLKSPVAMVPPDLEPEFMNKIRRGIANQEIFEIDNLSVNNITVKDQATVDKVKEENERSVGTLEIKEIEDEDGNKQKVNVLTFSEDEEHEENDEPRIITSTLGTGMLTPIKETFDDEE